MGQILLIEDDASLGQSLCDYIKKEGLKLIWVKNLKEASGVDISNINLVILDWMLPDGQGIDFLRELRQKQILIPIIMLTARTELVDRVLGLESGANDYITKPFEPRELIARIRVQFRAVKLSEARPEQASSHNIIQYGRLMMDLDQRIVQFNSEDLVLTKMEYDLLKLFLENPGRAFSREEILNKVWGFENYPTTRTVDTHVLQLRQKTDEALIETLRGIGYRFNKEFN